MIILRFTLCGFTASESEFADSSCDGAFAEARPTAYDKSGMLCPNLSSGQLKTKYDFEKENRIGDFSPRKGWQGRLAMV